MVKFSNDADGDVLKNLHKNGVNLTLPRKLDFYCYAADYETAKKIAEKTSLLGFTPDICEDNCENDRSKRFSVNNTITMIPMYKDIIDIQKKLNLLLLAYNTRCDGWGTLFD